MGENKEKGRVIKMKAWMKSWNKIAQRKLWFQRGVIQRVTATVLISALTLTGLFGTASGNEFARWIGGVISAQAAKVTDGVLQNFVSSNLGSMARYSEVDNAAIEAAVLKAHTDEDSKWSTVRMYDVLANLGDTFSDDGVNPWTEESSESNGSPYSPGVNYSLTPMSSDYTLGQLMIDYIRADYSAAGLLTDENIINIYDRLTEEENTPFIDLDNFRNVIMSDVQSADTGSNANRDTLPLLDVSKYTTYRQYVLSQRTPIPAGYLLIGTWLMDSKAITTTFYQMAVDSMSWDNQQVMLYKSELSSGYWKNIDGASGLEAILPLSDNVPESDMADYYISVVVGSDGIPHWAKTGREVDVFSIIDPYELEELPELKGVKAVLDSGLVKSSDSGSKNYIYWQLNKFFRFDENYERQDRYQQDCNYILDVSKRGNIAFYAEDYRQARRFQESGRGFLNSLEIFAENAGDEYVPYHWNWYDDSPYKTGWWSRWSLWRYGATKLYYQSMLIRGNIAWRGEIRWRKEVNAMGGLDEFSRISQNFRRVWRHYSCVHDDVTDECDRRMEGLGNLYTALCRTGDAEDKELASQAMDVQARLDSSRRYRVYYNLVENPDHNYIIGPALNFLYECISQGESPVGANYNIVWYTDEDFQPDSSVTSTVESAITECATSMYEYQANALDPGTTIVSQAEYDLDNNVINNAAGGAGAVRTYLRELVDLDNIKKNVIAHKSRELNMLTDTLIPTGNTKFQSSLHESASDSYASAAADPATTKDTLDELLKDQKAGVSSVAAELQQFIKARAMRLLTNDAIDFIKQRINWAEEQRSGITVDAFGTYANEALDEHIQWLEDLLATVKEGGNLEDEGTNWNLKVEEIENELTDALNNGDLDKADELEMALEDAQRSQNELEVRNRKNSMDPDASAGDTAGINNPNTPTGVAEQIAKDLIPKIRDKNFSDIEPSVDALIELDYPGLQDILDELNAHDGPSNIIKRIEEAIKDPSGRDFTTHYTENDTDSGNGDNGLGTGDTGDGTGNGSRTGNTGDGTGTGRGTGDGGTGDGTAGGQDGTGANGDNDAANPAGTGTGGGTGGTGNDGNGNRNGNNNGTGDGAGDRMNGNGTGGAGDGTDGDGTGTGGNGAGTRTGSKNGNGADSVDSANGDNGAGGNGTGNLNGDRSDETAAGGTDAAGNEAGSGSESGDTEDTESGINSSPITGEGTGLDKDDFDRAIEELLGSDFDSLPADEQAAVLAALTEFAKARDVGEAYDYLIDLLDDLLKKLHPFLYRQYLKDGKREFVSLAAVNRCRRYTRFRLVQEGREVTMSQIVGGTASYVFEIGKKTVTKSNGETDIMDIAVKEQEDVSLYGDERTKYPYITEEYSGKYLYNTCVYVPGTEWAVLITPQTDKKISQLLDLLDIYADS